MAKVNATYEVVYIMDPAIGEESINALIEKFKALVETQGTVTAVDDWGKRRLAYPINDLNDGHYVLMSFTAAPELPKELDRVMKITDGIMRSMIICKDA
jgi:small subunit ribosomal protein S6